MIDLQLVQLIVNAVVLVILVPIWRSQDRLERRFNGHLDWHLGAGGKSHDETEASQK